MKVSLSEKDRAVIVAVIGSGEPSWGGDEASLLVRDEMYDAIDLASFEDRKLELKKCSDGLVDYEVSRAVAEHMITTMCGARMLAALGRVAAKVVRRLRAALDVSSSAEALPKEP